MKDLSAQKCQACEGGIKPLEHSQAQEYLSQVPNWVLDQSGLFIMRKYNFKGFYATMSFINAVAYIAQQEAHHPDVEFGYNYCVIKLSTHAINGLSLNDFICAAKINKLTTA